MRAGRAGQFIRGPRFWNDCRNWGGVGGMREGHSIACNRVGKDRDSLRVYLGVYKRQDLSTELLVRLWRKEGTARLSSMRKRAHCWFKPRIFDGRSWCREWFATLTPATAQYADFGAMQCYVQEMR